MKYRKAVFIVVYSKKKNKIEYLILKRKLHWKGWEFPKGGINPGESKKRAVRREVFEETGARPLKGKIREFDLSGKYDYNQKLSDRPGFKGQTFQLYSAEIRKEKIKLGKEHSDYKWVSLREALKKLRWPNQKKALRIVSQALKEKVKQSS